MKNLFVIAAVTLCLAVTTVSYAQDAQPVTPKAAKKEAKMEKKSVEHKSAKAIKKGDKMEKKEDKMK